MTTYTVTSQGYECCPSFKTIEEAKGELSELVKDSLLKAKRRGHKEATKHKLSDDCYRITLGRDKQSTIYSHFAIVTI